MQKDKKHASNVLEQAIKVWETGIELIMCESWFNDKPVNHNNYMQIDYGERDQPQPRYQCNGTQKLDDLCFIHTPPLLVFVVAKELAEKITDVKEISKELTINKVHYVFAGCTIFCKKLKHFVAVVFHYKSKTYYLYDALKKKFDEFSDVRGAEWEVSLLVYFRLIDKK